MNLSKFISHPCFESSGTPSSTDHHGSSPTSSQIINCEVGCLSDSIKFEAKKIKEAGPVAGLLFISTEKVAFCSQRSVTFKSPNELLEETDRKIEIPIRNIRGVDLNESQQKKMTIITEDSSEFLFMDFLRYDKARQNLEEAILWQSCQAKRS
ncbi:hypothetical protein D5086_008241 [Populus alba]|uniref:GRAM domain-containing protein n=2 Tax=Populus alba TaxID=43335 RepID=A0A4U5PNV1_POPAL|nr:hypothetical protein D5086_0000198280 [Populus alba]